jgi:hypothetical protein
MPQVTNYPNDESVSLNDKVFGSKRIKTRTLFFGYCQFSKRCVWERFYSV